LRRCVDALSPVSHNVTSRRLTIRTAVCYKSLVPMPWRCPACRTEVRHDAVSGPPRVGEAYRCLVCRLDLRYDPSVNAMVIAPFERDHEVAEKSTLIIPPVRKK
jgi:rubredoxin